MENDFSGTVDAWSFDTLEESSPQSRQAMPGQKILVAGVYNVHTVYTVHMELGRG